MILLDFSQVVYSTFLVNNEKEVNEDLLRHMILNSIRSNFLRYKHQYGELIICADGQNYWRKQVFPYYKANRKTARDASGIDWPKLFEAVTKIKQEIQSYLPYNVIEVEGAEADDVIATIVKYNELTEGKEILILSGDKDLSQLQTSRFVKQYDPTRKKDVVSFNPERSLKEHIIRGDSGDGVPNIMSKDDVFVIGGRQRKVMTAKLNIWLDQEPENFCSTEMLRNFYRNKQLIDLSMIPAELSQKITTAYIERPKKGRDKIFNYFIDNKLKNLMESISDF